MNKKNILVFVVLLLLTSYTSVNNKKFKIKKIIIDAGHGGKDPGCLGKNSHEAVITLAVALELGKIIESEMPEVKVVFTRKKDKFVGIHERAELANKNNADLFISIHCNSSSSSYHGAETYTLGMHKSDDNLKVAKRENLVILQEENYLKKYDGFDPKSPISHILFANYQNAYIGNSILLAQKIQDKLTKAGRKNRGVRQAGFVVLWKTSMPSVLVEIGFLTNKEEEKFLSQSANQIKIAESLFSAIEEYKEDIEELND